MSFKITRAICGQMKAVSRLYDILGTSGKVPYPFVSVLAIPTHQTFLHLSMCIRTLPRRHLLNVDLAVVARFYLVWSQRRDSDASVTCGRRITVLIVPWTTGDSSILSCLCGDLWNRCLVNVVVHSTNCDRMYRRRVRRLGRQHQRAERSARFSDRFLLSILSCFVRMSEWSRVLHDGTCCRWHVCLIDVLGLTPGVGSRPLLRSSNAVSDMWGLIFVITSRFVVGTDALFSFAGDEIVDGCWHRILRQEYPLMECQL